MDLVHAVYEPSGRGPHPTIIALHGWGASAMDLLGLAPYVAGGKFLVVCPQGRIEVPLGPTNGYGWFPLTMGAPPDPQAFALASRDIETFVDDVVRRYPVDATKLVILGFSQGGVMAYASGLNQPQRFAALVCLSSWLPPSVADSVPGGDRTALPTLVHHGSSDELIDVSRARESIDRLRTLRVPVTYREFDMGHEINAHSLTDLSRWLTEHVLSPIIF
ncbi:MAG: alpha/beta fold hydrolase [Deltaproteobacteria bacterium]|nr:alpha/beta fold hydrolase [Deltaproteobacteria bacterium]